MTSADTRVNDLVVNVMTEEQFKKITPQDNQLYLTPDEDQEWKKPADWVDIRSGALPNSVYFLVGHSADYSTYPTFSVTATVSNSGTYDVYVDGIKQATTAGDTANELNWQTLALTSGYDVTYPTALKTHVVRVTPTSSSNTITAIKANDQTSQNGLLWAHFSLQNTLSLSQTFGKAVSSVCPILEIVTSQNGAIKTNNLFNAFTFCTSLVEIPTIDFDNGNISAYRAFYGCAKLKKLYFRNGRIQASTSSAGTGQFAFAFCTNLKKIETENCTFYNSDAIFGSNYALEKLPNFVADSTCWPILNIRNERRLKDTFLDLSAYSNAKLVNISGESANPALGWKGITVSNEAPFDETRPQLNVSYTGLSRAALVNLFKSMPYNVSYTVVGSPTIVDGVLSKVNNDVQVKTDLQIPGDFNLLEFVTKIGTKWQGSSSYIPIAAFGAFDSQLYLYATAPDSSVKLHLSAATGDTFTIDNFPFNKAQDGTGVYVKLLVQKNTSDYTYTLAYSLDKQSWTSEQFISSTTIGNKIINLLRNRIGSSGGDTWMDLNETYIKVNGVTWFNGAATRQLSSDLTVVGSPTITNGILSNTSGTKYLRTTNIMLESSSTFTFVSRFRRTSSSVPANLFFIGQRPYTQNYLSIKSDGTEFIIETPVNNYYRSSPLSVNVWYEFVLSGTNGTITAKIKNTQTQEEETINDIIGVFNQYLYIGRHWNGDDVSSAEIDLNNTYLYVNGSKVLNCMVPMTKTCSVVGCTGTADLTADDKAIATGKGWELTVA